MNFHHGLMDTTDLDGDLSAFESWKVPSNYLNCYLFATTSAGRLVNIF